MIKINFLHLRATISAMARKMAVYFVRDIFSDGFRMERRMHVVLDKFARGKVAAKTPKALFLSYCAKAPLVKLTQLGPLRALKKI